MSKSDKVLKEKKRRGKMIALEMNKRKAKDNLINFMRYDSRLEWKKAKHLEVLADKLTKAANGDIKKLMVFMPPRHGKSELVSKKFPAWYLGNNPNKEIIISSYSADLAYDFSRIARNTLDENSKIFGVQLASDNAAVKNWGISNYRGGLTAAGVGGPITGRGANIAIIDDPVKNWEEAKSPTMREKIWNWYQSVLRTRLAPGGSIVLVMTRWHEDDLAGRLLKQERDKWEVVEFPAFATKKDLLGREEGDPLWPDRYPHKELIDIKESLFSRMWDSLYQQKPRTDVEGALWNYDIIRRTDNPPDLKRIVVAIDPQGKSNSKGSDTNDTGIIVAGISEDGYGYVLEDRTVNGSPNTWGRKAVTGYHKYNADRIVGEVNQGGDMVETVIRTVDKQASYKEVRATRGKQLRAEPIAALYEQGKVFHAKGLEKLEDELTTWDPETSKDSPNRLDALVWALTELMLKDSFELLI